MLYTCCFCDYQNDNPYHFKQRVEPFDDGEPVVLCNACYCDPEIKALLDHVTHNYAGDHNAD